VSREKPEHNKYDNIWEIRREYFSHGYDPLEEAVKRGKLRRKGYPTWTRLGRTRVYHHVEDFLKAVLHQRRIKLPVYKVLAPMEVRETDVGAIYYFVVCDKYNLCFRGTYGYGGTGPHESALVEELFDRIGLPVELRSADFIITLLQVG